MKDIIQNRIKYIGIMILIKNHHVIKYNNYLLKYYYYYYILYLRL